MPLAKINKLYTQLNMKCMNDKEYCLIMKPFTLALGILQGEDTCFYGTLLPILEILMAKTLAVKNGLSKMKGELPDIIVKAIKSRFAAILDSKNELLATVSLPMFKLRWVSEKPRKDYIKFLLIKECSSLSEKLPAQMPDPHQDAAAPTEDDFFSFDAQLDDSNLPMSVETEVIDYLRFAPVMKSLHQFPRVKKVARQYNAAAPSSTPDNK
ncbi:unnamed protein product [Lepeophtheirus salmonis]|uniref:(salmon louse) hypothetical protein n=1 Tax=Lepeophtheirus salmonis TaxID=72036 RepID=A0A7R8D0T2_LEPSM|nr:unnamed protein product [Lepeophtheirus salmonis]CAF2985695.1 unnamed protein product [Lepeophtheirus salmonis]